jgi:hypothetical protein
LIQGIDGEFFFFFFLLLLLLTAFMLAVEHI